MRDKGGRVTDSWRKSCANCGGVVINDKAHQNMILLPAGLFRCPRLAHSLTGLSHSNISPSQKENASSFNR
eukprot:5336684-Prymnesium_polylepis.1